jgi:hypothetical protein
VGAFVLASGEAQAKEAKANQPPTLVQQQHTPPTGSTPLAAPVLAPPPVGVRAVDTSFPETSSSGSRMLESQSELALAPSSNPKPHAQTPPKVSLMKDSVPPVDQAGFWSVTGKPTPLAARGVGTDPLPLMPKVKDFGAPVDQQAPALGWLVDSKLAPLASEGANSEPSETTRIPVTKVSPLETLPARGQQGVVVA